MDYGRFFMVHPNADVTRKPVLFFYLPLRGRKGSRFPIFLAFYQNKINFYFDGQLKFKAEKDEGNTETEEYSLSESDLILSLDLTPDPVAQERLHSLLADAFKRKFPIAENVYIDIKQDNNEINRPLYEVKTYKDLDVFGGLKHSNKLSFKNLILDFLFEANRENSVFNACKQFAHIKYLMNQSLFLTALRRKAEFYYLVENYNHNENPSFVFSEYWERDVNKNIEFDIYQKKLVKAQKLWLETLHKSGSHKVVNKNNRWFENVEAETEKVFREIKNKKIEDGREQGNAKYRKKLNKQKSHSAKWLLYRTAIMKSWKILLGINIKIIECVIENIIAPIVKKMYKLLQYILGLLVKKFMPLILLVLMILLGIFLAHNIYEVLFIILVGYILLSLGIAAKYYVFDIILMRLFFLVAGATYFAFEIATHFNYYLLKNTWTTFRLNFSFSPNLYLLGFTIIIIGSSYLILLDNERKNHPDLPSETSNRKVIVLIGLVLFFSAISNIAFMNTFHFRKELFEDNHVIDEIWTESVGKSEEKQGHGKLGKTELRYVYKGNKASNELLYNPIIKLVDADENPRNNSIREHLFNKYLTHIVVEDEHGKELYPLVKDYKVFGFTIHIVPPVLYFNILLTLFLVVFFQVIIHHKKVVEGGHFE